MINLIKNKKTVDKILLGLAVLCLVMILTLSMNAFLNGGDDYYLMNDCKNNILNHCIANYLEFDGRCLTLGAFLQAFSLLNFQIEVIIFMWSLCFMGSGLLILSIINFDLEISFTISEKYIFTILFALIFWIGSHKHLAETIYWATGGIYSFWLFMAAIWIYFYLQLQKNNFNSIQKIVFLFYSILTAASTQNLTIGLITLVIIYCILNYLSEKKSSNKLNYIILISLIIGLLFIVLAPGNFFRMQGVNNSEIADKTILYFLKYNLKNIIRYIYWSFLLLILSITFGGVLFVYFNPNFNFKFERLSLNLKIKNKQFWVIFLENTKWFWITASTLTPFIIIPAVVSPRTAIYFMFFLTIFCVSATFNILKHYFIKTNNVIQANTNYNKCNLLILLLLISILTFTIYNLNEGFKLKKAITEREHILKNNPNKVIYMKVIDTKLNTTLFQDWNYKIENNYTTDNYIVSTMEKFYKTKIIFTK